MDCLRMITQSALAWPPPSLWYERYFGIPWPSPALQPTGAVFIILLLFFMLLAPYLTPVLQQNNFSSFTVAGLVLQPVESQFRMGFVPSNWEAAGRGDVCSQSCSVWMSGRLARGGADRTVLLWNSGSCQAMLGRPVGDYTCGAHCFEDDGNTRPG